ncbi:hypothetical protein DPX16_4888 [Anabarilius grahami]|uniref:Uncharacterized protein n=1 Tax=Anabarilius grahami TaxID=495550 RepID=A0A3N0XTQ8_ANAGA|nr:hypothetical protein DPX16_4888 [Anabarilius grahami]
MESEQSETFGGGGGDNSSGSDTLSEGETRTEPYEPELQFEEFKCHSSDFVGLDGKVKGNDSDECSDDMKARNGDDQDEGENEGDGDEDEMVKYID